MTSDSTWTTATYTELIGAKEVIFSVGDGDFQVRVFNMGDGTNCTAMTTFITPDNAYNCCREFTVNFKTGVVKLRQQITNYGEYIVYKNAIYR